LSTKSEQASQNVRKKSYSKLFPYFLIPAVVKPEVFSPAKPHSVTTMCPCHHKSPNDLTRKYYFYVYLNSIMTSFFKSQYISLFSTTRKRLIIWYSLW